MSELMNARNGKKEFRGQLLTTVSALTLLATIYGSSVSKAADQDADRPTVWIELGGQLEHVEGQGDNFPVGFLAANPNSPVLKPVSPLQAQNPLPFEFRRGRQDFNPAGGLGLGFLGRPSTMAGRAISSMSIIKRMECSSNVNYIPVSSIIRYRKICKHAGTSQGKSCHS